MSLSILRVHGIELAWERTGSGPPLLLLNGSGTTMAETRLVRGPFEPSFEVVSLDYRGMGASSVPTAPFTMADVAADALALLDHLGLERASVAGISFGGMVALELAVTAPDRVERLALLCTSAGGGGGSSYPLHERRPVATVIDTRFTPAWLADHREDASLLEVMAKRSTQEKSAEVRRGEALQLEARRHHDVWDRLHRITCPTLVATGRYDGLAPPANSEAIAGRIAGSELRHYEGGHSFFVQDPAVYPDVIAFLTSPSCQARP